MSRDSQLPAAAACIAFAFAVATVHPASAAAVGSLAYVGNQGNGTISVIDTSNDTVVRTVPAAGSLGKKIQAVIADHTGRTLFAVDAAANALLVVDATSGALIKSIDVGRSPEGASISPSGKTIAVCVEEDNLVALVDVASATIRRKIQTQGKNPEHCDFSADERWLLASDENSDDVDVIDVAAGRSIALVHTAGGPRGIAWLPRRKLAYVAQERGGGVDLIDIDKHTVSESIPTGLRPADVIAGSDGKLVFVSNGGDGTVSAIDTASGTVIATTPVGKRPWNMALGGGGRKLYVANGRSDSVSVIDTTSFKVLTTISVGALPWGVDIPHVPAVH